MQARLPIINNAHEIWSKVINFLKHEHTVQKLPKATNHSPVSCIVSFDCLKTSRPSKSC